MTTLAPDQVLNSRLIVKPRPKQEEKIGSVVVPGSANAELSEALVVKIADELKGIADVGGIVIYPSGAGVGQLIEGEPHLWLKIDDIWGYFKPGE